MPTYGPSAFRLGSSYAFDPVSEPGLVEAADGFLRSLRAWDHDMPCRRYAPLHAISRSLEY